MSAEIADCLIGEVRDDLDAAELADHAVVRQSVLNRLAALAPCANDAPKDAGRPGSPFVMALVGPTGVGKTTTIAKLAATYKMRYGKRVGLITTDTYRIGAVDQLRTYANIVGIPLHVAMSVEDVESAMAAMSDREVILIDTAGRSPRDTDRIDELARFLASGASGAAAARRVGPRRHLLPALRDVNTFQDLLALVRVKGFDHSLHRFIARVLWQGKCVYTYLCSPIRPAFTSLSCLRGPPAPARLIS